MQRNNFVTIVSGLPRSGTSMMMKMLQAGGMPVVVDNHRKADDDNPNGYYEFEPVKKTRDDPSWIPAARGKAVKIVYRLLYDLPAGYDYRILFLRRKLEEVVASQNAMLQRQGQSVSDQQTEKMMELFQTELRKIDAWLEGRHHFLVHYVDYNRLIDDPSAELLKVNGFLDGAVDFRAMIPVVDSTLCRNRR